ncbi:MAG: hypothetical protein HC769_35615 [Cyanobacteria bacterium CRU_2_1]|nr:hypothetical protein [Cyanobacteria bacterium CRU_2_1]
MINIESFGHWYGVLGQTWGRDLDANTIAVHYQILAEKLSTEQFIAACHRAILEDDFFPLPKRLVELGKVAIPDTQPYRLPAYLPKAFADMSLEEQVAHRAAIARARPISGLTSIGQIIAANHELSATVA